MQLLSSLGPSYSEGNSQQRATLKGWVVHLISMHNLHILTQAKLSPGPMGDVFFF